jgi:hypothetical protein
VKVGLFDIEGEGLIVLPVCDSCAEPIVELDDHNLEVCLSESVFDPQPEPVPAGTVDGKLLSRWPALRIQSFHYYCDPEPRHGEVRAMNFWTKLGNIFRKDQRSRFDRALDGEGADHD